MTKKYINILKIIFPNKKINAFVLIILFLGIIAGAIYVNIISLNDQKLVIDKIKVFIDNISNNSLNALEAFKNSIGINLVYVILIWVFGLTLIGFILSVILLFFKGFIFGFSIASFIVTYGIKGLILSFIYLLFGQLLNIIITLFLAIYSFTFSLKLLKVIFKKGNHEMNIVFIRKYLLILIIMIIISFISSISESFILPSLIKIIVKLFI